MVKMLDRGKSLDVQTPLLYHGESHRKKHQAIFALIAGSAVLVVATIMSVSSVSLRGGELLEVANQDWTEAARIEAENHLLEQEEQFLVHLAKSRKSQPVSKQSQQMPAKRKQNLKAKLETENQRLRSENEKLQKELLLGSALGIDGLSSPVARRSKKTTMSSLSMKQDSFKRRIEQLVGKYVKTCNPSGCKVVYQPEDTDRNMSWYPGHNANKSVYWDGQGHKHLDVSSNMFSPFGPVRRQNITRYQVPYHDIVPKASKLGDNWVGFGHGDNFVKVENSGLGILPQLPPWKQAPLQNFNNYNNTMKPFNLFSNFKPKGSDLNSLEKVNVSKWRCPGDPEGKVGKLCISGGDGVDGVYESFPLSPLYYDPNEDFMEKRGVTVDSWPWLYSEKRHKWGRDAKDHYKAPKGAEYWDYDSAKRPYWAYDNHAMRSLPAYKDPEGPANKQLMLGRYWKSNHGDEGLPGLDDDWVHNASYFLQLEPAHGETLEDDHFANWTHFSPENVRLVYGESAIFNGMRLKKNSTNHEVDPWSLGDVPVNISQYADLDGVSDTLARNGDPIHDLQLGWQGQNMVAASSYNLQTARPKAEEYAGFLPSQGRVTLEKKGVNVGGPWFE